MIESTRKALVALLFLLLAFPAGAAAVPTQVKLRVEGATQTIFEGDVTTDGHDVTTPSSGTHKCDGTNGGANPSPGPTPTTALDDGARLGAYTWDGTWFDSFQDFLIDRVGPDSATQDQFWGQYVNSQPSQVGGCQQLVGSGDEVLWAFDAFSKQHVLRLSGPASATTNEAVDVTVVDGQNGSPISGADVAGVPTGPDGHATLRFGEPGVHRLKASRADSVRSNAISLCVDPPGAEPCTSSDRTAPTVAIDAPDFASDSRSGRFAVSWQGNDGPEGTGVANYDVEARRLDLPGAPWRPLVGGTRDVFWRFGGIPGAVYEFRVRARDRAANLSAPATDATVVPFDNLDRALRYGRGWKVLRRPGAYQGSVLRSRIPGARATISFRGSRVVLIGRRLPKGGRLLVRVDGRGRRIRLRGRGRHRQALYGTLGLGGTTTHTMTLIALGGGPVEFDALAALP
jgi:hypothetical protein